MLGRGGGFVKRCGGGIWTLDSMDLECLRGIALDEAGGLPGLERGEWMVIRLIGVVVVL